MSGHSRWANIKHRKAKGDAARGSTFTKIGRELAVAVRSGGADPESNSKLKDVIYKAKSANMPNDNIQRSIKKASGSGEGDSFEEITYEGYGVGGVAVIVKASTDNRNRTAGDVRHLFDKGGGNLGTNGCVSFLFQEKGVLIVDREDFPEEEAVMSDALEAGAEDFTAEEEIFEIETASADYYSVREALEKKGYTFLDASIRQVPVTWAQVEDKDTVERLEKMLESLEEHDDVLQVYHNWET